MDSRPVGLLTFHFANNYGALLQAFALRRTLGRLGRATVVLNRVPPAPAQRGAAAALRFAVRRRLNAYLHRAFDDFRRRRLGPLGPPLADDDALGAACRGLAAVVVGSDQVWRPDFARDLRRSYLLAPVAEATAKIAYAPSFGRDRIDLTPAETAETAALLARFRALSVREASGVRLCRERFGVEARWVLDPTLLLDPADFGPPPARDAAPRLAFYILDRDGAADAFVAACARRLGLPAANLSRQSPAGYDLRRPDPRLGRYRYPPVGAFLRGMREATAVVTDSFHGTALALLFGKPFVAIDNPARGSARIADLLGRLGAAGRLVDPRDPAAPGRLLAPIDYNGVRKRLAEARRLSLAFLAAALP